MPIQQGSGSDLGCCLIAYERVASGGPRAPHGVMSDPSGNKDGSGATALTETSRRDPGGWLRTQSDANLSLPAI
jgi:hypothetical protein